MKKKEYIKPAVETIEINGEAIMSASPNQVEVSVTSGQITTDSDLGAKENTFDIWE